MPLRPRGKAIHRVSPALCHCHCAATASRAAPRRQLSELLGCCSSVWGEGTGRGMHIRLLVRLQTPCHRAGYQSRGAVWEAGRLARGPRMSASRSLSGLVDQQRGPAHPDPTHRDIHKALRAPSSDSQQRAQERRALGQQGREAETADSSSNYPGCYFSVVCLGANG